MKNLSPAPGVVDLKRLAGRRYRIVLDESAELDGSIADCPWYHRIPCRYGHIGVWGENTLSAYASGRIITGKLAAILGVRVVQRGDSEIQVTFAPELLETVASVLGARQRRRVTLTEEQKAERRRLMLAVHDLKRGASRANASAVGRSIDSSSQPSEAFLADVGGGL